VRLVDLTMVSDLRQRDRDTYEVENWKVPDPSGGGQQDARVYVFHHDGMLGTYVDFPGHLAAADNGTDAANYPPEKLYRLDAAVIHLDRADGSGRVTAEEMQAAAGDVGRPEAVIVNALGRRRWDQIAWRSVYLAADAADWIVSTGAHLLVSDVYESDEDPQDVFGRLFRAGLLAVCLPVNLHELTAPRARLTVLTVRFPGVTQLPCRVLAEIED